MKRSVATLVTTLVVGAALGAIGSRMVTAQQGTESRAVLPTADLVGIDGHEVRMWRTDIGPGAAGAKHYHPGTECIYVLEGALTLDESGRLVQLKAGDAHCVPPKTDRVGASQWQQHRAVQEPGGDDRSEGAAARRAREGLGNATDEADAARRSSVRASWSTDRR